MTGLLVDTQALLWWRAGDERLSLTAAGAIAGSEHVSFSAASIWEIAIKRERGKLDAPADLLGTMAERGFVELPISADHAWLAGALPSHHRDPFDRILVAQAQLEDLALVTADAQLALYGVPVVW